MPKFQDPTTGQVQDIGSPELNPTLTAGKTLVPDSTKLGYGSMPINSSVLASTPSVNFTPPNYNQVASNTNGANVSIPTPASIINQANQPTTTETQQSELLKRIATLTAGQKGQQELTNTAEAGAGVPALTSGLNDIATQIEGLNNQATALQNEAAYTIPNQMQVQSEGRGITTGGLAPITASALRMNQIKQGAIATQSLTLKSAFYAAQGKLSLAKDAADKAAIAQYEGQLHEIAVQKANLDAIAPTLNREQQARAEITKANLDDRQKQIETAQENKKAIIGWAATALKNNPNNQAAQYAANEAMKESNQQNPDLVKAFGLVSAYQSDPAAAQKLLDEHLKAQQDILEGQLKIAREPLEREKLQQEINTSKANQAKLYKEAQKATTQKVASSIGTSPLDVLLQTALTSVRLATTADRAANYYQKLINEGKQSEAEHYVNGIIQNGLTGNDAKEFSLYGSAGEQSTRALEEAQKISSNSSGVYKTWLESAKPFADLSHDQNWIKLQQAIELAQAPFLRSIYGTAITATEQSRALKLSVDVSKDDISTIVTKLSGMRQFATDNRNRIVSASVGQYDNTGGQNNQQGVKVRNIKTGVVQPYNGSLTPQEAQAAGFEIVQ